MENKKSTKILVGASTVGLILIGLAFFALGVYILLNPAHYDSSATAVISKIEVTGSEWRNVGADDEVLEDTHAVYVSYTFNGTEIKDALLDCYSSTMKVGDSIDIEFNADDTAHVSEAGFDFMPIIFMAAGAAAAAVGVVQIIRLPKARARYS